MRTDFLPTDPNTNDFNNPLESVTNDSTPNEDPAKAFSIAAIGVGIVWTVGSTLLIGAIGCFASELLRETILVSVLSGLIALVAIVPGLVSRFVPETGTHRSKNPNYLGPLFGGVILRMLATVALFALCRYQMAETVHAIAAMVIGWYVVLTMTEVALLARYLPRQDVLTRSCDDDQPAANLIC